MTFYTYLWLREDGSPWYVGKGTWNEHRPLSGQRAYRKRCPPRERVIIQEHESEIAAVEAEKFLISYYGRRDLNTGILRNRTDGGEGLVGALLSKETLAKRGEAISKAKRGKRRAPFSAECRANMSKSKLGNKNSLGRTPWNKGLTGVKQTEEQRRNTSEAITLWWSQRKRNQQPKGVTP